MTQDKLDLLKSQFPVSFNITGDIDYPRGMNFDLVPVAKISGTIGQYGVILTWKYEEEPDNILVEYIGLTNGNEKVIPILELREFLLKLKG
jgi:hypothetical protein